MSTAVRTATTTKVPVQRTTRLVAIIATLALLASMIAVPASATAGVQAAVGYSSYKIVSSSNPSNPVPTQTETITFTYNGAVSVKAGTANVINVTIGGRTLTDMNRPLTVAAQGNNLVLTIGPNPAAPTPSDPNPTAIYGGLINVTSSGLGSYVAIGSSSTAADLDLTTLIPGGSTIDFSSASTAEGVGNIASIDLETSPNVRGIVNIGIYKEGPNNTLVPIDPTLNAKIAALGNATFINGLNAYITHVPRFDLATPTSVATDIATTLNNKSSTNSVPIATGYTVSSSGSVLTITGPSSETLYIYIVDDELIKALDSEYGTATKPVTYASIAGAAVSGTLPGVPPAY
jgi:hypothetical protein